MDMLTDNKGMPLSSNQATRAHSRPTKQSTNFENSEQVRQSADANLRRSTEGDNEEYKLPQGTQFKTSMHLRVSDKNKSLPHYNSIYMQ